jgi:hypothetical protein
MYFQEPRTNHSPLSDAHKLELMVIKIFRYPPNTSKPPFPQGPCKEHWEGWSTRSNSCQIQWAWWERHLLLSVHSSLTSLTAFTTMGTHRERERVCVCVCVCVRAREGERERRQMPLQHISESTQQWVLSAVEGMEYGVHLWSIFGNR